MSDREEDFGDEAAGAEDTAAMSDAAGDQDPPDGTRPLKPGSIGALAAVAVIAAGGAFLLAMLLVMRVRLLEPGTLATLAIAGAATLVLAGLAWWAIRGLAGRTQRSSERTSDLLGILSRLNLESDFGWQDPRLRADTALARFLAGVQERDHTQQQQLARAARLDQEITRLGSALLAKDRAAVLAEYRDAAVGRASTGAALLYDEIDRLERELAVARVRLSELGGQAAGGSAEAWRWNASAQARLNAQVAAGERLAQDVEKLGAAAGDKLAALESAGQGEIAAARAALGAMPEGTVEARAADLDRTAQSVKDLVARGGSLAIQTALEVTRLGERGAVLLPLTDSLKGLVAEFQGIATRLEQIARAQGATRDALAAARRMVAAIDAGEARDIPEVEAWRRTAERVAETQAALRRQSADIAELAHGFGSQSERLQAIGAALADLTGVPSAIPLEPEATLPPESVEPEAAEPVEPAAAEPVEPAAAEPAEPEVAEPAEPEVAEPVEPAAAESVEPATAESIEPEAAESSPAPEAEPAEPMAAEPAPTPQAEPAEPAAVSDAFPTAEPSPEPERRAQTALHEDSERIYDLADFGAVALDEETAVEHEERIYDLSEFGAVALG